MSIFVYCRVSRMHSSVIRSVSDGCVENDTTRLLLRKTRQRSRMSVHQDESKAVGVVAMASRP